MSEIEQLSKRVDDHENDMREMRQEMHTFTKEVTSLAREMAVLNTSMAALQRRQVEKTAHWSRLIEVIATASFVFSAVAAGLAVFH